MITRLSVMVSPSISRRSDATANDEKIVSAARTLASTSGQLPSMKIIADAAGVGVMTLYRRFPTKERLVTRIQSLNFCDQLVPAFNQALENPDGRQSMRRLTRELIALAATFTDPKCGKPVMPVDLLEAFLERFFEPLCRLMRLAQECGALRPDVEEADIPSIATIMLGGLAMPGQLNDAPERYIALIFEGLEKSGSAALPPLPEPSAR